MFITFIELIKPAFYHAVVKQAFLVRPAAEVLFKHFVGGNDIKLPAGDFPFKGLPHFPFEYFHFPFVKHPFPVGGIGYNGTPFPGRGEENLVTSPVLYFI